MPTDQQRNPMTPITAHTEPSADQYMALLGEIDALLGDARQKVNTALLASMDHTERLRSLTRLDSMLADPARFSHDLLVAGL
jgi:hypothetical protein